LARPLPSSGRHSDRASLTPGDQKISADLIFFVTVEKARPANGHLPKANWRQRAV
jgi:hypothetical protein